MDGLSFASHERVIGFFGRQPGLVPSLLPHSFSPLLLSAPTHPSHPPPGAPRLLTATVCWYCIYYHLPQGARRTSSTYHGTCITAAALPSPAITTSDLPFHTTTTPSTRVPDARTQQQTRWLHQEDRDWACSPADCPRSRRAVTQARRTSALRPSSGQVQRPTCSRPCACPRSTSGYATLTSKPLPLDIPSLTPEFSAHR